MTINDQLAFRAIINTSQDGFLSIDHTGKIIECNQCYCDITGYTRKQLISQSLFSLDAHRDENHFCEQLNIAKEKETHSFDTYHKTAAGMIIPVEIKITLEPSQKKQYLLSIRDHSERKEIEQKLQMAESVFNNSHEAIMITDAQGEIKYVNHAFTTITGYTFEDALFQTPALISSGRHDKAFYDDFWHTLTTQGHWSGEIWNKRKNGEIYPEWLSISSIKNKSGKVINYISLFNDISHQKSAERDREFLAYHDGLTKLPNRALLYKRLAVLTKSTNVKPIAFSLIFINLDRFKVFNDSLGHQLADELLIAVGRRLRSNLRGCDTLARIGGDEFVILVENNASSHSEHIANHILSTFHAPFKLSNGKYQVSASLGITIHPNDSSEYYDLLSNANIAMLQAKKLGGNQFAIYDPKLSQQVRRKLLLERDLQCAIEQEEISIWYQPQVNAKTHTVYGVEALVRWQHPIYGLLSPMEFIPLAEENGFINELGAYILVKSMEQLAYWKSKNQFDGTLAVNLSSRQIAHEGLIELVKDSLTRTHIRPAQLELEVTETTFLQSEQKSQTVLSELRALGVQIAIDDFGTGYSSLSRLKSLPIDNLKIDKVFIDHINESNTDQIIADVIVKLAKSFNINVIAEGIESQAQANTLSQIGCVNQQGYFYAKPMPADDFIDWLSAFKRKAKCE